MSDPDETKPVSRSITVDPERIVDDDPTTDEADEREGKGVDGKGVDAIVKAALAAAPSPTEALRWLALAYCALGEEAENPRGVHDAGIALIRAWRDAGSVPELFAAAPEAFDLSIVTSMPDPRKK